MIETGIKGKETMVVSENDTARVYGSGTLDVFATPAMVALMEKTCLNSVAPYLEPGEGTVGTLLHVKHTAATPVGMTVTVDSELVEVDRRRLVFEVKAFDETGAIGEGRHERFVIQTEKFMAKANDKLK
ncbi:MAG: thioesterase family protein [Clostridiales bacterium]|nr:thioesterase family protein [Clostridiales bacterium]MDY3747422.1 thioesterase family protein [Lachnospiraceae bacterium]